MIAITHPIKQMINNQYGFLSSMLERFPNLLDEWFHKQEEEIGQMAKAEAKGDVDVYLSLNSGVMSIADDCDNEEQLFNQAMLIMVYSYYESLLCKIAKEIKAKSDTPSEIVDVYNEKLEGEYKKISVFLHEKILPLRNEVCHNNNGTLFSRKSDNNIPVDYLAEMKYISIEDGRITSIDRDFIKKVLDGEHKLLLKLAEICGIKTKWYAYKDGAMKIYEKYEDIEN